jgi:hypothetical protein
MSRFDELNKLFDPWRKNWVEQYREHQMLPGVVAKRFQEFLGCPEDYFSDSDPTHPQTVKYVSPASSKWDDKTKQFILTAYNNPFSNDLHFHDDGFYYFGMRVFLEHGPTTTPKTDFWFLFRAMFDGSQFTVREQRSGEQFELGARPNFKTDALCEHLFDLLKADLAKSPLIRDTQERNKIGFR